MELIWKKNFHRYLNIIFRTINLLKRRPKWWKSLSYWKIWQIFQTRRIIDFITNTEDPFYYDLEGHGKSRNYKETYNDIIILKLDSPLTFKNEVKKVCLPPDGWQHGNQSICWQSGWQFENKLEGLTIRTKPFNNILRYEVILLAQSQIFLMISLGWWESEKF